jgi:hypothetical protein
MASKPTGRPMGRPRTSAGWASVTVRLPLPTVEAYRALPAAERSRVALRLREVVEQAVDEHEKGGQ